MKAVLKTAMPDFLKRCGRVILRQSGGFLPQHRAKNMNIFGDADAQIFFGYYDVTPFSAENRFLLAQRLGGDVRSPHDAHPALEVGFFDLDKKNPVFQKIGETKSWNWQQGCRLQWFDAAAGTFAYNCIIDNAYGSVVQTLSGEIVRQYSRAIYALDPAREWALSLDFSRLHNLRRGYGYSNFMQESGAAIERMDLRSGTVEEIISLGDLADYEPMSTMAGAQHYINHLAYNPSGGRFMFFHLWQQGSKRFSRLFTAAADGTDLRWLAQDIRPSHYCWMNDETLLITGTEGRGHMVYAKVSDISGTVEILDYPALRQDGHPSCIRDRLIVSDTYPDIFGRQRVFLQDFERTHARTLGVFYMPPEFTGEMRCDLHPRISVDRTKICVDIVYSGRWAMAVLDI